MTERTDNADIITLNRAYTFTPYDVLQVKRPGRSWEDYATIRTHADYINARKMVDSRGALLEGVNGTASGWRIRRVLEDRTVYVHNPEA